MALEAINVFPHNFAKIMFSDFKDYFKTD